MASVTLVSRKSAFPLIRLPKIRCNPLLCSAAFIACDVMALVATGAFALCLDLFLGRRPEIRFDVSLWPALGIFFAVFAWSNLYPGIIYNAVTELRRLGLGVSLAFLIMAAMTAVSHSRAGYSHSILLFWWLGALLFLPLLRSIVRGMLCRRPWWGIPVAVFYTGEESIEIVRALQAHPEIGLRPVVILSSTHSVRAGHRLPVLDIEFAEAVRGCGVRRAMIALPDAGSGKLLEDLEKFESLFPHVMIMHGATARYSLTVDARPFGGSLAVEVRRDLLLPLPRIAKRAIDLLVVCLGLPTVGMLILLLGLLVRLESKGPVFYGHRRIGRSGNAFRAWKIRTMQRNADELLQRALAEDPALREEWLRDRKLRHDPRITRVGRFLRKTSLDELPQLWNVLRGEMSLVGPRPIVEEEIAGYGGNFSLYCRVTPGVTGLWQVSGRNDCGLRDRVRLDSYYVRNWSPWLDLHILARTAKVVFTGQGAY